ncbi:MAG: WYL domain-containing protein [Actinobacteria bacterium]|nr:WYL domain-containing protein [Actinomycetota bacterium]MCB9412699.1 WYL domain-containing protein [Actinomycetota bacterium]
MAPPRYVQRLGMVFEALAMLDLHPGGLELVELAELLDVDAEQLRADLIAYNSGTELGPLGLTAWVEFLSRRPADPAEDDDDLFVPGEQAVAVRLHNPGSGVPGQAGGLTVSEVGQVLIAAEDLARTEPENLALAEVIAQLRSRWLPGVTEVWRPSLGRRYEAELTDAVEQRRKVVIEYDRTWRPGIITRTIEPYALVRTQRGFEVDAGPIQPDGSIRTYLVKQIRSLQPTAETFDRPSQTDELIAANRRATDVSVVMPRERQWVTEYLAEHVTVIDSDTDVQLQMSVVEPLADRVGLVLLQAGPGAFVTEPADLIDCDDSLARQLLAHHGLDDDSADES